ncbi:hypothetical protein PB1_06107 [Bacillus methanolicus PB1]|uniref:Uncharacterized protein n=1 Tax=Bacillus methanolicus PB1 TaxID=997296 RepID=I3E094_BACMT|nr:hypothetical protein [Bacillus methanolicus]EIJ79915.1 hypothetical protein PB1_06107 [Bacillus methanolicus PB1]
MYFISEYELELISFTIFHQIFPEELSYWLRLIIINLITAIITIGYAKKKAENMKNYSAIS